MARQEQLERIRKRVQEIRQGATALTEAQEAGMEVEQDTTVDEARSFVEQPEETPATTQEGAVDAESLQNGGTPDTPEPTAPDEQEAFQAQLGEAVESARSNLEGTIKEQRDQALKRQEELNQRLEKLQKESDPENRETFNQEQRIIQNQLDAAETASASLEEDFNKRRQTVNELEQVLTEGNQAIEQARNQPVAMSVLNKSVTQTAQNAQARAGVLEATLSGLDGNMNAAHSIINNASNAVASVWNDQLAYNQAYMKLVEGGQLAKNKIHDQYAQQQTALAERKLNQLEETRTYLKELMIDPQSSQFISDAGITLNDSIEEINTKMAEQSRRQEREETKAELMQEGYEYVAFPGDRTDVVQLEVAGQTMSFVPPQEEVSGAGDGDDVTDEGLFITDDGESIDLTTESGIQILKDRDVSRAEANAFIDNNVPGLTSSTREQLLDAVYGADEAEEAINQTTAKSFVASFFNPRLFSSRSTELSEAKEAAVQQLNSNPQIVVDGNTVNLNEDQKNRLIAEINSVTDASEINELFKSFQD